MTAPCITTAAMVECGHALCYRMRPRDPARMRQAGAPRTRLLPEPTSVSRPSDDWTLVIRPRSRWWDLRVSELWAARELILLFVWRDFVSLYKQTILGPLWYVVQPLLTTVVFTVIFGRLAQLSTDAVPQPVFYLSLIHI